MASKLNSMTEDDEEFNSGFLLHDIEEISKALYLDMNLPMAFNASSDPIRNISKETGAFASEPGVSFQDSPQKEKKSSIWKWKPLKVLSHMRSHRFNCYFFLHVHAIEGLPFNFNNFNLCVTWKQKNETLRTRPAPIYDRMAEFEETLMHRCTIYASTSGAQKLVDYEPKLFLLRTFVIGAPSVDIGKHWIDLTRLLPLTLDDLEGDQRRSGKWTTSFKLTGSAEGAMLNVSFSFSISESNPFKPGYFVEVPNVLRVDGPLGIESAAEESGAKLNHHLSRYGTTSLDELFSNRESGLGQSISLLYQKLDEGNMGHITDLGFDNDALESLKSRPRSSSRSPDESSRYDDDDVEYTIIEQGIEVSTEVLMGIHHQGRITSDSSLNETLDLEIFLEDETNPAENIEQFSELDTFGLVKNGRSTDDILDRDDVTSLKEPVVEKLDSDFYDNGIISKPLEFDLVLGIESDKRKDVTESSSNYHSSKLKRSLSLVRNAESIEDDFLKMLSISHNPPDAVSDGDLEFPGYYPGKQIVEETRPFLDSDSEIAQPTPSSFTRLEFEYDCDLELSIQEAEKHNLNITHRPLIMSTAKIIENMETELLMQEWGLDEGAFLNSQHSCSGGFGSPVYIPAEEPLKTPSLGENLGPIIKTRSDGFLRSMNPLLFRNSQNRARLIVQVSAPFVFPLSMGSNAIEVLQRWASLGVEKMSAQVKELMPLEDITEKTIQDMVTAVKSGSVPSQRWDPQDEQETEQVRQAGKKASEDLPFSTHSSYHPSSSDLDDMECEYASLENLVPVAIKDVEVLLIEGLQIQSGFQDQEAPSSTKVPLYRNSASMGNGSDPFQSIDVSELVEYAIPLKEWIRLSSGNFDPRVEGGENGLKVFAAQRSRSVGLSGKYLARKHEDEVVEFCEGNSGIADNHFTVALKVQLRDPLRNYEMVGPFMLALIEVEKRHRSMLPKEIQIEDGMLAQERFTFKVFKVNLAGLSVMAGNNCHLWGTIRQQQSGARWLLSSGLGMKNKHPTTSNSSATIVRPSNNVRRGNVLWSISSQTHGESAVWNDLVALNIHVRNPDIIVPNEDSRF